jgi:protease IV
MDGHAVLGTRTMDGIIRRFAVLGLLVAVVPSLLGCKHPFRVNMSGDLVTRVPTDNTATPVAQRMVSGNPQACHKVAIIDVDGMLLNKHFKGMDSMGENPVSLFHEKLNAAAKDPSIKAVVLRINSPGGSVTASDVMRRDLLKFKQECGKPVVASVLDVGAGGAYYLASACDLVAAHPTSVVGGVGVVLNVYSLQEMFPQQNILPETIRSGDFVDMGSPVKVISEDGEKMLQGIADEFHARFQDAVLQARPNVEKDNLDGRIFTASQAMSMGFVDEVAYLDDAIMRASDLAGVPGNARVVMFRRANDRALTEFDITPNAPSALVSLPLNIPGLDRASLPMFLYLWQPDPGLEIRGY